MFDLHVHSYFSDGKLSPKRIAELAARIGLQGISLSDHDTYDGIEQMLHYGKKAGLHIVPAVEFGTTWEKDGRMVEIHILGYLMDPDNDHLNETLQLLKDARDNRIRSIIQILRDFGLDIEEEEVFALKKRGIIGRGQLAQYMVNKKFVQNAGEAFERYIGVGKFAYVPKTVLDYRNIMELIHESGGVAVCAHPKTLRDDSILEDLLGCGLDGIEIINSKHNLSDANRYLLFAKECPHLIATAGSDCHGHYKSNDQMYMGRYACSQNTVDALYQRADLYR